MVARRETSSWRAPMPLILAVIVSIGLVTAARLRQRVGCSATRLHGMTEPRWLAVTFRIPHPTATDAQSGDKPQPFIYWR